MSARRQLCHGCDVSAHLSRCRYCQARLCPWCWRGHMRDLPRWMPRWAQAWFTRCAARRQALR